jgi:peptidoglycan hydrolase-like protein with peptidoglycan-binding domain
VLTHEVPVSYRERPREHDAVVRRPVAPAGVLAIAIAGLAVFGIDAMMGGSGSGSGDIAVVAPADSVAPADRPALAAVAAPTPTTPPQPAVETEGCQLDVGAVQVGDTGPAAECVQRALAVAGYYTGPIDGNFSGEVAAAATTFQIDNELYVDGIVGRRTAEQLGIWPGDDSFVTRTPPPAPGAVDLMGYELSSVASAGDDAPPLPDNAGQGTGRRIVYSRLHQRVWAIDDEERIVRSYLVAGSQYNNEVPGIHEVYSRSDMTTGWNGEADLPLMVRWLDTERGAIGFHQIPFHKSDGSPYQTEAELGQRLSGGCQRQARLDAVFMWDFGQIGTPVHVL